MTCEPSGTDGKTPVCLPAGSAALGAACQMWTDCVRGAVCADGVCRKLCCGKDWTGCPANERCFARFVVQLPAAKVDSLAYLCLPVNGCSALDPASCAAIKPGTTCQIADPTGATACLEEGTGQMPADPCPCKGGFTCVSGGCRRLCKAVPGGGEPSCPEGEGRCVHWTKDPEGVGECSPN